MRETGTWSLAFHIYSYYTYSLENFPFLKKFWLVVPPSTFFYFSKYSPISLSLLLAIKNIWNKFESDCNLFKLLYELIESIWKEFGAKLLVCIDSTVHTGRTVNDVVILRMLQVSMITLGSDKFDLLSDDWKYFFL